MEKEPIQFENIKIDGNIFQMTITEDNEEGEWIRIYKGDSSNSIDVIDMDNNLQQILLKVEEKDGFFTIRTYYGKNERVIREKRKIDSRPRYFLMGKDEIHLFISQIEPENRSGPKSIEEAHELLKPKDIRQWESKNKHDAQRQGEWFFLPETPSDDTLKYEKIYENENLWQCLNAETVLRLNEQLKSPNLSEKMINALSQRKRRLVDDINLRKAHMAEQVIMNHNFTKMYVRGKITHEDHRIISLKEWNRAYLNREVRIKNSPNVRFYD